jgi:hypothetical protein
MNKTNKFLDRNLTVIIIFGIFFIVSILIAEKFLFYSKLGAYSNLIVAFTSICAILIALRQGEINFRISRIDNKVNAHFNFKIALFYQRVFFVNQLRTRCEKIESLIYQTWDIPFNCPIYNINPHSHQNNTDFKFKVHKHAENALYLGATDLKLFVTQSIELLNFEEGEINLEPINQFIAKFKSTTYFLSNINKLLDAIDKFKKEDKEACKNYIKNRILEQEEYNYSEGINLLNTFLNKNDTEEINFLKFEQMLQSELEALLKSIHHFKEFAPWKEFKQLYESLISETIKIVKIEK